MSFWVALCFAVLVALAVVGACGILGAMRDCAEDKKKQDEYLLECRILRLVEEKYFGDKTRVNS